MAVSCQRSFMKHLIHRSVSNQNFWTNLFNLHLHKCPTTRRLFCQPEVTAIQSFSCSTKYSSPFIALVGLPFHNFYLVKPFKSFSC